MSVAHETDNVQAKERFQNSLPFSLNGTPDVLGMLF